ncbi:hypothetical protein [Nocardioides antri]|uniref:hypothetical protein n=1 Tax=Nocardioides antri TaxID=2607659 RepID=UPI00165F76CE|nr:hypothetical protein [Nocardioides antri]
MLAAHARDLPVRRPAAPPTPGERQATWAAILLSLLAFWYGAAVGVSALWNAFAG